MFKRIWMAAAAASVLAPAAAAAEESASQPAPANEAQEGVLVYTPDFFAASNPATALDMVSRIPGFSINDGAQVRGYAGSGGNILIDGARPASRNDSGSGVLSRTPADRVERIELIRGGAQGVDMQGHSVVVNVMLRGEAARSQAIMGQLHLFEGGPAIPSARYDYAHRDNGREWGFQLSRTVAMSDSTGHGVLTRRGPDGAVTAEEEIRNKFDGGGWFGRVTWAGPVRDGRLELTGSLGTYVYEDRALFIDGGSLRRFAFRDEPLTGDVGLRFERPVSDDLTFEGRLMQSLGRGEMVSTAFVNGQQQRFEAERETGESIARGVLRWRRGANTTIEGGGEIAYNFLDIAQVFTVNGTVVPLPLATTRVEELRGEAYATATFRRSDTLSFSAGARLEHSTIRQTGSGADVERSFFYPKPRLTVTWTPAEGHQVRGRIERELGQLNFSDFAASTSFSNDQVMGGNIDLRPQQRWISELVYERRFNSDGVFTLTLRHDEIVDVIDRIPLDGGLSAIGNIGDGTLDRAAVNLRLPLRPFGVERGRLTVNAQYDHTRVTDPTTGERRGISRVRPLTGSVGFENDVPDWNLTWGFNYTPYFRDTTYHPDQTQFFELRDYTSVFAEYTFSPGFTLRAQLTVWDDFYIEREVYADRTTRAISFSEEQRINPRDFLQLRLRRSF